MEKINKDSLIPLHTQLSNIIRDMIERGELKEGDAIVPERELCEIQDVSRMTVNKAIVKLVSEGLLYRVQGRGTFVSQGKKTNQFSKLQGFTEVMKNKGIDIRTDILSFEKADQSDIVRQKLRVFNSDEYIYKIKRLRYIEEDPFGIEISYIRESMFKNLTKELINNKSLYKIFEEVYGYKIKKANQTIEPMVFTQEYADLLKQDKKNLALKIKRTTFIDKDIPLEYTISIFRSDKYQYEIALSE